MSYVDVINSETVGFIQKSVELILKFRDFERNVFDESEQELQILEGKPQDVPVAASVNDIRFQLTSDACFPIIRTHLQSLSNWTKPETKELIIEIFASDRKATNHPIAAEKVEQWRFGFAHFQGGPTPPGQTRVLHVQQYRNKLAILLRTIASLLTASPVFARRKDLKITRRVHFARETLANDLEKAVTLQENNRCSFQKFESKIFLLHHAFDLQFIYKRTQSHAQHSTSSSQQQISKLSQYSIYSHVDEEEQEESFSEQLPQSRTFTMSYPPLETHYQSNLSAVLLSESLANTSSMPSLNSLSMTVPSHQPPPLPLDSDSVRDIDNILTLLQERLALTADPFTARYKLNNTAKELLDALITR